MANDEITRDSRPVTLASWKLRHSSGSGTFTEAANIGSDFAGRDIPKYKFLFTVSFEFGPALLAALKRDDAYFVEHMDSNDMSKNAFACKNVTRPNISVNYADINSYNFRYKVATKTDYGTVTLILYDDNKNKSHKVVSEYLKLISPIANTTSGGQIRDVIQRWASLGPLPQDEAEGLIHKMRVTHHVNANNNDAADGHRYVAYDYINPKIQSINFDELDMGVSDVNTISVTFVYDSVNIVSDIGRQRDNEDDSTELLTVVTNINTDVQYA